MLRLLLALSLLSSSGVSFACAKLLDFQKRQLAGTESVHLCEAYKDKVILIVNTASKCAFTPQYDGLEKLYADYKDKGLVVLGFPSNDFGAQEPGTEKQIQSFCRLTYSVDFPMFEKTRVRGEQIDPLYQALIDASGHAPRWNFHKYLLDRKGNLVNNFASHTKPNDTALIQAVESLL